MLESLEHWALSRSKSMTLEYYITNPWRWFGTTLICFLTNIRVDCFKVRTPHNVIFFQAEEYCSEVQPFYQYSQTLGLQVTGSWM